jgi:hypothetical protein
VITDGNTPSRDSKMCLFPNRKGVKAVFGIICNTFP